MNEIVSGKIKRTLKRFGLVVYKGKYRRGSYDRENFPKSRQGGVVFDIGANIGQSAIWFSKSLEGPQIHAFEPLGSVYETLQKNTRRYENIQAIHRAVGDREVVIEIPRVESRDAQAVAVLGSFDESNVALDKESFKVITVDGYAEENGIDRIDILKTDTEGYDLSVAKGAERMLSGGRITYFISEVTITRGDTQHTQFDDLRGYLRTFGYDVTSFMDLEYAAQGQLDYFNALFERVEGDVG